MAEFKLPTEIVDLPSKGLLYPKDSPLSEGKIEIKKAVSPALSKLSKITQKKPKFNKGGRVGLKGGTFPDLNKDGETTFADVLIGRGVIPKNKKNKKKGQSTQLPQINLNFPISQQKIKYNHKIVK